jgi:hypothetical protein
MMVEHVEVLVEEPSMEAALRILLPQFLHNVTFEIYRHLCKEDLLHKLPNRLRGYRSWLPANWRIVVLLDRDNDNCRELKQRLEEMASEAGFLTRSTTGGSDYEVVTRLAIEELEAWYFGDWEAVRAAYPKVATTIPKKAAYRDPDAIQGGTWQAFERELNKSGYFRSGLRKIQVARDVAAQMRPDCNTSKSFQVFRAALNEMGSV